MIAQLFNVGRYTNFGEFSIINSTFIDLEETSSYWSVQFFSTVPRSPLTDNFCMTGILSQDYSVIRGFTGHHQSANLI